ncbi:4-(cytidine 5'-diphospho)-2-C-methyl-D-erythritol kinase [Desulfocurvus sp. DL9XJH121]
MTRHPETIALLTGCKVNLHLEITGRLDNGYHSLRTLFLPLPEPHDELELAFGGRDGTFSLAADDPALEGEDNTLAKAWRAFGRATGFAPGLAVRLAKGVPMGAGLGGGSADAAALLKELNARAGERALPPDELAALAATIGADVPFFLLDGPAWAEGIGDRLTPVSVDLAGFTLLLVCPAEHVSSAWAYRAWDEAGGDRRHPPENRRGFLTCGGREFKNSPRSRIALFNSFEDVAFKRHPNLLKMKEKMFSSGASGAVMSGSGASLLALYRNPGTARTACEAFRKEGIPAFLHTL